jgi:hypothetical protein
MALRCGSSLTMPGHGSTGGLIGNLGPKRRRANLGDLVLLRDRAELLALRVAHQPLDLDRLLAASAWPIRTVPSTR